MEAFFTWQLSLSLSLMERNRTHLKAEAMIRFQWYYVFLVKFFLGCKSWFQISSTYYPCKLSKLLHHFLAVDILCTIFVFSTNWGKSSFAKLEIGNGCLFLYFVWKSRRSQMAPIFRFSVFAVISFRRNLSSVFLAEVYRLPL